MARAHGPPAAHGVRWSSCGAAGSVSLHILHVNRWRCATRHRTAGVARRRERRYTRPTRPCRRYRIAESRGHALGREATASNSAERIGGFGGKRQRLEYFRPSAGPGAAMATPPPAAVTAEIKRLEDEVKEEDEKENEEQTEIDDEARRAKLRRAVAKVERNAMQIVTITESLPSVLLANFTLIAIVVSVGVGMIVLRFIVMLACPEIARHAKTYATVINFLFGVAGEAFSLITIKNIINLLGFLTDAESSPIELAQETATVAAPYALGIAHFKNLFHGVNWHTFSTDDIQTFFSRLPVECAAYDNIQEVFLFPAKALASPAVCPLIRFTWPVEWLYSASTTLLGWLSWDADPTGNNCVPRDTDPYAWVCVGLGAGYIIIDILLPLLLFMLFAYKYVFPTLGVVVGAAELAAVEGGEAVKDAEKTIGDVVDDVEAVLEDVKVQFANSFSEPRDWPGSYI